jgi:hypothetical protein
MAFTKEKMAMLAPMPRARDVMATIVNAGDLRSSREREFAIVPHTEV